MKEMWKVKQNKEVKEIKSYDDSRAEGAVQLRRGRKY